MKYFIKTYGCQMNEYDSDRLKSSIEKLGYKEAESYIDCDLVILNTCSIREKADEKMYSELGRINIEKNKLLEENRYMIIGVTGCVPETAKEDIFKRAKYVDFILGPQSYFKFQEFLNKIRDSIIFDEKKQKPIPTNTNLSHLEFTTTEKFDFLAEERKNFNGISAFISVQEGCDKFCTYCVVPNTRGRQVSRPYNAILDEVKKVLDLGAKEIFLLGQNVTAYKDDSIGKLIKLSDLIQKISEIDAVKRIKYTTSHPTDMDNDIVEIHKNIKLTPYLHLPVQSGSDNVLKRMNRKYTREDYFRLINAYRKIRPDIVFSSDFIVGFPGETDQDFEDTMDLIRKVNYSAQCFSFAFSRRPATVANVMKDQLAEEIKLNRLKPLQALLEEQKDAFNNQMLDKTLEVLFDDLNTKQKNQISGRSQFGQIVLVECSSEEEKNHLYRNIKNVKINKINPNSLIGSVI